MWYGDNEKIQSHCLLTWKHKAVTSVPQNVLEIIHCLFYKAHVHTPVYAGTYAHTIKTHCGSESEVCACVCLCFKPLCLCVCVRPLGNERAQKMSDMLTALTADISVWTPHKDAPVWEEWEKRAPSVSAAWRMLKLAVSLKNLSLFSFLWDAIQTAEVKWKRPGKRSEIKTINANTMRTLSTAPGLRRHAPFTPSPMSFLDDRSTRRVCFTAL